MKKIIKIFLVCLFLSIFLEIFVFNFKTFTSYFNKSIDVSDKVSLHNLNENKNGIIKISNDKKKKYIEIKNINRKIKNIYLNINVLKKNKYLRYTVYAQDEANKYYFALPERLIYSPIEKSKYISFNLSGKSKNIKIYLNSDIDNNLFKINSISINNKIPLSFSVFRFILTLLILMILWIIRPKSEFYKYKINFKNKKQIFIIILTTLGISLFFLYTVKNVNTHLKHPPLEVNHTQYNELAKSFSRGHLFLDVTPTKELKDMKNPYDFYAREKSLLTGGLWDHAYYKGKYYVYFGAVPVVLCYLPYYLMTGKDLPNYILTYIITIIIVIGMLLFLKEITKRYFKNIPLLLFIILFVFLSSTLLEIVEFPSIYTIPIAFALMFTYWGLYLFISSIKEDKLSTWRLFLGSLCMALVAGCRPQLLLGSFLVIPIFWKTIFKERKLFSKKSIKDTIAFLLPYVIIAIIIMLYNYCRFGSILDFGANYNLTTNDMTKRGFNFARIGFGVFKLLFQPPYIQAVFPFVMYTSNINNYMGMTIIEPNYGGLIATNIVLCLGLLFFKFKKYIPKILYNFSLISVISGFIILIFDIEAAGILPRYILDFSWTLFLPTIFVIMGLINSKLDKHIKRTILSVIIVCIILGLTVQFLISLQDHLLRNTLLYNPKFYFKWYYLLQWWL